MSVKSDYDADMAPNVECFLTLHGTDSGMPHGTVTARCRHVTFHTLHGTDTNTFAVHGTFTARRGHGIESRMFIHGIALTQSRHPARLRRGAVTAPNAGLYTWHGTDTVTGRGPSFAYENFSSNDRILTIY